MRHSRSMTYVVNDSTDARRIQSCRGFHTENSVNLGGVPIAGMFGEVCDLSSLGVSCS